MSTATATRPHPRPACSNRVQQRAPHSASMAGRRPDAAVPAVAGRSRSRVHLTGRGRGLVVLVLVALLLAAFAVGRSVSHASVTADSGGPTLTQVTVQAGDTLWSVSRRLAPQRDPREVVEQLQRLNQLATSELQVGQQLLLPLAV